VALPAKRSAALNAMTTRVVGPMFPDPPAALVETEGAEL
jgi:hypothetical protein